MNKDETSTFAERVQKNQQRLGSELRTSFDYIICGAGTSGCVVAARLAADPTIRVLVVEAGSSDETDLVMNPSRWPMTLGSELDWGFVAEENPNLNGRAIPYGMGKVLGGGSSINLSTWSRGHQADWDFLASEAADTSWNYEAVLKIYRERIESWSGAPDPEYRGTNGVVHVQPAAKPHPFSYALLKGAESVGFTRFPSPNGRMMEEPGGCAIVDETVLDGRRQSIFRSYLYPAMHQPNITVLTGALAGKILFDGNKAVGVEFTYEGKLRNAEATHEVILSSGAVQTPKLLMQSGIGNPQELTRVGIPVLQSLPGVGRNLHDHVGFGCVWETAGDPLPPVPRSQTACFWKTDPVLDSPNFYAYSRPGPAVSMENAKQFTPSAASWSLSVGMRPQSRGTIHLTGARPTDPVKIDANYLAEAKDLESLKLGLEMARALGNSAPLKTFRGEEILPGPLAGVDLEQFLRNGLTTFWHQSCTAKMGRDDMSVVDSKLKVHGVERLRIADSSILPRVTSGNTMAPCVVIGERAAMLLKNEQSREE
jgi:choline dehydrogenase